LVELRRSRLRLCKNDESGGPSVPRVFRLNSILQASVAQALLGVYESAGRELRDMVSYVRRPSHTFTAASDHTVNNLE
jgi:hypothetical protein